MSDHIDCIVIGAGVVGLAIARELATAGREVVVLERNANIGEEISSRNSEVIHAGIYYPTDSLKARLCVSGKELLYAYCASKQIPHARCGKLIVATDAAQLQRLEALAAKAKCNGVEDLEPVSSGELKLRQPELTGVAALWSPSTGIVDSHALMQSLAADLEAADGMIATHTAAQEIVVKDDRIELSVVSGAESSTLAATTVINSAGLGAIALAKSCRGIDTSGLPVGHLAKGNYFAYKHSSPFKSLVYPLPVDGGLGVHATIDLSGQLRFGPDVEWIEAIDYAVSADRLHSFADAIRTYWPSLTADDLTPSYAGIRPKLSGPGEAPEDFRIDLATADAKRQLLHLLGIESPGLTASLAIGIEVRRRLARI